MARVRVKYKLNIEVIGGGEVRRYDVGTLQAEPTIPYLASLLGCVATTSQPCASAKSVSVQGVYIQSSGYNVSAYPSQSNIGTIKFTGGSVSLGSFSLSMTAQLNNPSLSGSYTLTALYMVFTLPNGNTATLLINLSGANISAQNGYSVNIQLSGTVSISGSGVLGTWYQQMFTEFWAEVLNALGVSTSCTPLAWYGSGNAILGLVVNLYDTAGNVIGTYSTQTSSGQNISGLQVTYTQASNGLSATIQVSFTFTAPSTDQLGNLLLTLSPNVSTTSSSQCPGLTAFTLGVNIPSNIGGSYTVTSGSAYMIQVTDSISISTST